MCLCEYLDFGQNIIEQVGTLVGFVDICDGDVNDYM